MSKPTRQTPDSATHPVPFRLDGEVVLITGGGTGLGRAMADCMVVAGARVVLLGRRRAPLQQSVAELGDYAAWVEHDVTDAPRRRVAGRREPFGAVTVLVICGIHFRNPL